MYWFNPNYVVRLIFAFDGSLARVELLPEALFHSDSWTSVPDPVELGRGEMQQLIDSANRLRSMGDPVSIHKPPDACFQSGPNLYCGDSYELASVSTYCHYGEPLPHVKAVTIVYTQSVSGRLANIKTVSPNQQDLQIGSLWYRILKKQEEPFAATIGSSRILAAFVDHPFESNRTIPELDSDAIKSTQPIENAHFSPEEISEMTATVLGCVLAAKANGDLSPSIVGRLDYDSESMPGAQVMYKITLPQDNSPGWGEVSRTLDDQHFIHFEIQAPSPSRPGAHLIRVKAILKWNGGRTEMTRDVKWMSSGDARS